MNSEKNLKDKRKRRWRIGYNFCYDFVKVTGAIPVLLWMRPKVIYPYGKKRIKGAALVSSNHRSLLDPIIVHCAIKSRRLNCLATKELYNTKLKARFFNLMHCIMVDKENFSLSSFHDVVDRLRDGKVVVIFPEGQINSGEKSDVLTFKSGAVLMAHKSGAPILPIYIVKKEKWYQRQIILIGEPFDVCSRLGGVPALADLSGVSAELREKELELHEYYEKYVNKSKKKHHTNDEKSEKDTEECVK